MKNLYNSLYYKIYDTLYSKNLDELWNQRKPEAIIYAPLHDGYLQPLSAVNLTLMQDFSKQMREDLK